VQGGKLVRLTAPPMQLWTWQRDSGVFADQESELVVASTTHRRPMLAIRDAQRGERNRCGVLPYRNLLAGAAVDLATRLPAAGHFGQCSGPP
jgi:hypothetical protein